MSSNKSKSEKCWPHPILTDIQVCQILDRVAINFSKYLHSIPCLRKPMYRHQNHDSESYYVKSLLKNSKKIVYNAYLATLLYGSGNTVVQIWQP